MPYVRLGTIAWHMLQQCHCNVEQADVSKLCNCSHAALTRGICCNIPVFRSEGAIGKYLAWPIGGGVAGRVDEETDTSSTSPSTSVCMQQLTLQYSDSLVCIAEHTSIEPVHCEA